MPGFVAILSGPDHRFRLANRAYEELVGSRSLIGKPVAEALPEVVDQGFLKLLDSVHESGAPFIGRRVEVQLENPSLDKLESRFLDFIYQPIFTDAGQVSGIFVQGHDVSDQVEAEEAQELLINELNHRVKNTLAIVQGLAMQSFKEVDSSEPARKSFEARLNALAAAHSLLTSENWESAAVCETIRKAIAASTDIERVSLNGPDVLLGPQTAVSLAMIAHELTTNAIKYGALSTPDGRVAVQWTIEPHDQHRRLTISWIERGGPRISEPERRGFGTRLIRRGLSSEMDSKVDMHFAPEGLECSIVTRLEGDG